MDEGTATTSPRSAFARLAGWGITLAWPILGGAILGMSIAVFAFAPAWDDIDWYLYAATRLLDGAHIYHAELADVNPPLIIWISAIAVALGRVFSLGPLLALKLMLAATIAASITWCVSLIRRSESSKSDRFYLWLAIALLYFLAFYPRRPEIFAQREHMLAALILPYLVLAAGRLGGKCPSRWEAAAIGLAAATGICLKPYQVVIVLGIETLILWRLRTPRSLIRPELVALALAGIAYCVAVLVFTPDFIFYVAPLARDAYLDHSRVPLSDMMPLSPAAKAICHLGGLWRVAPPAAPRGAGNHNPCCRLLRARRLRPAAQGLRLSAFASVDLLPTRGDYHRD